MQSCTKIQVNREIIKGGLCCEIKISQKKYISVFLLSQMPTVDGGCSTAHTSSIQEENLCLENNFLNPFKLINGWRNIHPCEQRNDQTYKLFFHYIRERPEFINDHMFKGARVSETQYLSKLMSS